MSIAIASIMSIIALLHVLWGLGIWWPIRDEAALARAVVGSKGITEMPPKWASLLVAGLLIGGALWALVLGGVLRQEWVPNRALLTGALAWVAVLLIRGVATYLPFWQRAMCEEPFRRFDRLIYAPLCLGLGVGFVWLLTQ